jgi:ribosome-binding factor A
MAQQRQNNLAKELIKVANEFLSDISNRTSLITITHADVAPNMRRATIYVSIFPDEKEQEAFVFLERQTRNFYTFMKSRIKIKFLPQVNFALDIGEKNRQRIDQLV